MTITTQQVKLLMKNLKTHTQEVAAAKSGMSVKTARKYIKSKKLPNEIKTIRTRKAGPDIFTDEWPQLIKILEQAPGIEAKTLLNYLIAQNPNKFNLTQLRTMQRKVRDWRALYGKNKAVIFNQNIKPGKQSQSDFTCMNSLNITIDSKEFNHLLFHFMLPYSRWESINLSFTESFDSLVTGFEKAVWELGALAPEHRTDNLSAATKAMGSQREFTQRWQQFIKHYGIIPTTNNVGVSHENGSVEKSHDTLKSAINQVLLLRGNRDFTDQAAYITFIEHLVKSRNIYRNEALVKEIKKLKPLPQDKWNAPIILLVRVSSGSTVQILSKPYTVPSRLIHFKLKAYVHPNEIILFYGNKRLQVMPRIYDDTLKGINYRHIIDSLVRKPGAFANYRYHDAMFPRLCFRQAYDALRQSRPASADKQYLKLLQLAKIQSEQQVADAIELLLEDKQLPTIENAKSLIDVYQQEKRKVAISTPNLADYDQLLTNQEFINQKVH